MSDNHETSDQENPPIPKLLQAVVDVDLQTFQHMIQNGADISTTDDQGFQAIHYAAEIEDTSILEYLLEQGVDPTIENEAKLQPIHLAANMGLKKNCEILLEHENVDIEAQDCDGWTPLCFAVRGEYNSLILFLMDKGADPEFHYSETGHTPLHLAAELGYKDVLSLFIKKEADLDIVTDEGLSLLHCAAMGEFTAEVIPFLINMDLDPNQMDEYHWYPIHYAIREQNVDGLKALLQNGANPYHSIGDNYTAFDQAEEKGNEDIIKLLNEFKDNYEKPIEPDADSSAQSHDEEEAYTTEYDEAEESSLVNEYEVTGDEKLEEYLRDAISQWSNQIPHHNMKNFGKSIEIHGINYRPSYMLLYRTLYDNRRIGQDSVPYTGQNIPARKYYKASDVDVWDFELAESDHFRDYRNSFRVPGSEHVITCPTCQGSGKITCPKCHGQGRVTCPSCRGKGTESCYSCYGRGTKSCTTCGGSGRQSYTRYYTEYIDGSSYQRSKIEYRSCNSCGGNGRRRCSTCGGSGRLTCKKCGGSGKITCSRCAGTGRITCTTCHGYGKMMNYFYIQQTLNDNMLHSCIHNGNVFERYPKFYIHPLKTQGEIKLDETAKNLSPDILDKTHLSKVYHKKHNQALNKPPLGVLGSSTKIQLQNAKVLQVDVYDINYSYEGKEYRLVVWGYDTWWNVYASESPFSELRDKFIQKAETAFKWRRIGKSYNWLDKADDLDVHNEGDRIYEMKKTIAKRMYRQYKFDNIIGGILSGGFFGYLTYKILQKPHFIFPTFNENYFEAVNVANKHHFVVGGLYILYLAIFHKRVYHFVKKYYDTGIRSEIMRFVFPILLSVFFGGLAWGVLYLANATGLTLIATGIVNLFIGIGQWIFSLFGK